ncbi:hypothetical protein CPAV1605_657 [seawater metagenome]|uniref:Uncharacterized protein n=1 Tax=seawater metagenome TaxID=1561972 RepID=A0A5E8CLS6_9ZZZZ
MLYINKILTFGFFATLAQMLFVSLSYGQLILRNSPLARFLSYYPLIILLGGIQTLLYMKAARYGVQTVQFSVLTIQLSLLFFAYFLILILNSIFLKQTITSITDFIGLGLMITGIYLGEKYKKKRN